MSVIAPGTPAPQFKLARQDGSSFSERDLLGHGTVLVFYPFAFSPMCAEQLQLYEGVLTERINHLTEHLREQGKDHHSRRGLLMLVGRRRRFLSYLQRTDLEGYRALIKELGLRK